MADEKTPHESQSIRALRIDMQLSDSYRVLCDAIDNYRDLESDERTKLAGFMTRERLALMLDMVERYLRG